MKKLLFLVFATVAILSSCSRTVVDTEIDKASNFIAFDTYKNVTKGNPVDDNAEFMTAGNEFGVTAFLIGGTSPYMGTLTQGSQIRYNGGAWNHVNSGDRRLWPATALNFYAYAPYGNVGIDNLGFDNTNGLTFDYTVAAAESGQVDLMFASALNVTKPAGNNAVTLIFRHALTQVHFKVGTLNQGLFIDIAPNGIVINNIMSKANFTLPSPITNNGWNSWSTSANYTVTSDNITTGAYIGAGTPVYTQVGSYDKALMLLPQVFAAWNPLVNSDPTVAGQAGAYLAINCKVRQQLEDGTFEYLKGDVASYATIYVPISSQNTAGDEIWNRAKRITYNLLIGGGSTFPYIEFKTDVEPWEDVDGGVITNS